MEKLKELWAQICVIMNYITLNERIDELNAKMVYLSQEMKTDELASVGRELAELNKHVDIIENVEYLFEEYAVLKDLESYGENVDAELAEVEKTLTEILAERRMIALFTGEYDKNNAFVNLHAGEGGTEAQDWVEMMARMYMRWAERRGFKVNVLDSLPGDVAGLKSINLEIIGDYAFGYLKSEAGVHRLVRVSPFDSQGRRHTSFSAVEVIPELEDINPDIVKLADCEIQTFRSGGPGGQHQNKVESGVRLIHKPTGLVAECREERSQIQNREKALKMLQGILIEDAARKSREKAQAFSNEGDAGWGNAIRSYVFMPYQLVKDNRSGYETGRIDAVMDGDLDGFMEAYLGM